LKHIAQYYRFIGMTIYVNIWVCCLSLLFLQVSGSAQNSLSKLDYEKIDKKALAMPESSASKPEDMAAYFMQHFSADAERTRAAFVWVASNIRYDIGRLGKQDHYKKENDLVSNVLRKRRGLCGEYAALFKAITIAMEIPCETIVGYTRTDGRIDTVPHAWNAVKLNGEWHLIDATWGAGHIRGNRFYPSLDNTWFLTKPELMIHTHMPFEPMWQLLGQPLSYRDFAKGIILVYNEGDFAYSDSITSHLSLDIQQRSARAYTRLSPFSQENKHIRNYVRELETELAYYHNISNQDLYNQAVDAYNAGIDALNAFLMARNKGQIKRDNKEKYALHLSTASEALQNACQWLDAMKDPDKLIKPMRDQTFKAAKKALADVDLQKKWLESLN
jgi:hypothetical protein